ncbi:HTH domain-containing protein [Halomarina halobia]|uniref:HTH domain-containing protein n=1 Tax=Halomarina halobia TaxID=3033386 RepID=A0ABD6A4E7_9EURY|nr:HTH domain-containing protein [Halomarina sp. PSR21]
MALGDTSRRTVEVYVRSLTPGYELRGQEEVLERLRACAGTGEIDGYDLYVWGSGIDPESRAAQTKFGRFVLDRLDLFGRWAKRAGAELDFCFPTCARHSTVTGESFVCVEFPSVTLVEFEDDRVSHVAPCHRGGDHVTVRSRLKTLESATV